MLYKLAHIIKERFSFMWDIVEWGNATLFKITHKKKLDELNTILKPISKEDCFRVATTDDLNQLVTFFEEQPTEAFTFFKPHRFDLQSLKKVLLNQAFLTFIVIKPDKKYSENGIIVGYFFLRCFINGKCFRGKIVHKDWQGKGIAKIMGIAMTTVSKYLGMRMFGSISPENYASLASAKASNDIKVHNILDNGYYYIEFLPKK